MDPHGSASQLISTGSHVFRTVGRTPLSFRENSRLQNVLNCLKSKVVLVGFSFNLVFSFLLLFSQKVGGRLLE